MKPWSEEEITYLKENWSLPPDMKKLQSLIRRSHVSIYERAKKLGLKTLKYSETYKIKNQHEINQKQQLFLSNFKRLRVERKALRETKIAYETIRRWIKNYSDFNKNYEEIKNYIESTKRCVYCGYIGKFEEFRFERNKTRQNWKSGICKKCDSKRIMKKNSRDLETKLKIILKATRRKDKFRGRTISKISNLTLKQLHNLYQKQDGKCFYTGEKLEHSYEYNNPRRFNLISLDRLDSEKGYTISNVVFCCWGINKMKNNIPFKKFILICKIISERMYFTT